MESLSLAQARRIALAAQGFADKRHVLPTMRTFQRTLARTGVLQVDSVNVLQRAHYMPLYSRMGPYDVDLLRRAAEGRPRRVVEYWAHVQAFMPVELWPVMRFRMAHYADREFKWWPGDRPDAAPAGAQGGREPRTGHRTRPRRRHARAPRAAGAGTGPPRARRSTSST